MELLCEKCRRLIETERCPVCGSRETRTPESSDYCFLAQLNLPDAATLSAVLEQKEIPFRMLTTLVGKTRVVRVFYVPYGKIDEALSEIEKMWGDDQPVNAYQNEGTSAEVFTAEEIDRMETAQLDDMSPDELKAYKSKIMKTLKEIRVQEQKWKQRTNLLLDMKEEAENLIDDLS